MIYHHSKLIVSSKTFVHCVLFVCAFIVEEPGILPVTNLGLNSKNKFIFWLIKIFFFKFNTKTLLVTVERKNRDGRGEGQNLQDKITYVKTCPVVTGKRLI